MSTSPHELPDDEDRPVEVEGVPPQEGISEADAAERVHLDPEQQPNFPDDERTVEASEDGATP